MIGKIKIFALCTAIFLLPAAAFGIGISFDSTSRATLEDAALFTSVGEDPPYFIAPLGDFNLGTVTQAVVDIPVGDASSTHWWLIGHVGDNIVYSSNQDLLGVSIFSVEPFSLDPSPFNILLTINALDGFNATGDPAAFGLDLGVWLTLNHSSHIAPDGEVANLWRFGSPGDAFGRVAVSINTNTPPSIGTNGPDVPEPSTWLLLGTGLVGLFGYSWRKRCV